MDLMGKMRVYQQKIQIYNDNNEILRKLKEDDIVEFQRSKIPDYKEIVEAIFNFHNDIQVIVEMLQRNDDTVFLQIQQLKKKLGDFLSPEKRATHTWTWLLVENNCTLEYLPDIVFIRRLHGKYDFPEHDNRIQYNGQEYKIVPLLEEIQMELDKYTFTETGMTLAKSSADTMADLEEKLRVYEEKLKLYTMQHWDAYGRENDVQKKRRQAILFQETAINNFLQANESERIWKMNIWKTELDKFLQQKTSLLDDTYWLQKYGKFRYKGTFCEIIPLLEDLQTLLKSYVFTERGVTFNSSVGRHMSVLLAQLRQSVCL
jgi:hypothetical protein